MRTVVRRMQVDAPPERVFEACLALLRTADPSRGVVARRCEPDPPVEGGAVLTTVRDRRGERTLRAVVTRLEPGREVAMANDGPGAVATTRIRLAPQGAGTLVTLTSEALSGLPLTGRAGRALDLLLLGGGQRAAAAATLRRLQTLVAET